MTYDLYDNVMNDVVEPLLTQGLDGLPQALTILLNMAMKIERQQYCGARDYERSDHRHTYSNNKQVPVN